MTCLVPSPPVGWGLWSFWRPAPPVWGSVFYRDMVRLLPLVSSTVIVTCSLRYRQNLMLLVSPGKRCACPCSDAVLRSCEEALAGAGIILHRPPFFWFPFASGLCGTAGSRGGPRGRGGGGWGPGTREHIYIYIHTHIQHKEQCRTCLKRLYSASQYMPISYTTCCCVEPEALHGMRHWDFRFWPLIRIFLKFPPERFWV